MRVEAFAILDVPVLGLLAALEPAVEDEPSLLEPPQAASVSNVAASAPRRSEFCSMLYVSLSSKSSFVSQAFLFWGPLATTCLLTTTCRRTVTVLLDDLPFPPENRGDSRELRYAGYQAAIESVTRV